MAQQRSEEGLLRIAVIILGVIVLFPLLMMVFAMPMMGMMGWWGGRMAGGLSPLWGVGMLLVWLAVLVGIGYLLYRGLVDRVGATTDRPLEELRVAYARGEITDEEFAERRAILAEESSQGASAPSLRESAEERSDGEGDARGK